MIPIRVAGLALSLLIPAACQAAPEREAGGARNVILLIGDGMGFAQVRAYRGYQDDPATTEIEPTIFDPLLVGAVSTRSAGEERWVIDSAAAATAYASGVDTLNGFVGLDPAENRLPTVLELAKERGKSTGLVTTSQITHATPAAFAAHVVSRGQKRAIADQLLDNRIDGAPVVDVLLGGGAADLIRDDRDLTKAFADLGYAVIGDREGLRAADRSPRLLGLFAPGGLPRAWDRPGNLPSLAEMTSAALSALDDNQQGFFLMVEGAQIDWASHDNDIVGTISEMEDFAAAAAEVMNFARRNGETLVVITADHETGGLSIGADGEYVWDPAPLRGLRRTPVAMVEEFSAGDEPLSAVVGRHVPFDLTGDEKSLLDGQSTPEPAYAAICRLFDRRTGTGWASTAHTGVDVPLYAFGPGSDRFRGLMDNEQVGQVLMTLIEGSTPRQPD